MTPTKRWESLDEQEKALKDRLEKIQLEKVTEEKKEKYLLDWDVALEEDKLRAMGTVIYVTTFEETYREIHIELPVVPPSEINEVISKHNTGWSGTYKIRINRWESFLVALKETGKKFAVQYRSTGLEQAIKLYLKKPRATIDISEDNKRVEVEIHKGETFLVTGIKGIGIKRNRKNDNLYSVSVAEIHNVFAHLEHEPGIEWTDKAKEMLEKELKRRRLLDEVALLEDYDGLPDDLFLPDSFKNGEKLRPFQRIGIRWLELNGFRGLLGDQMGLGKTVQSIGLFQLLKKQALEAGVTKDPRVLIVTPAAVKINWTRELKRFTGKLPYMLYGEQPENWHLKELLGGNHEFTLVNYDIISTVHKHKTTKKMADGREISAEQSRFLWIEFLNAAFFDMVILDEVHYIKNTDSNRSKAIRQLECEKLVGLTGTPVLNRPGELWSFLTMLEPEKFPSHDGFLQTYTWDGKQPRNVEKLRDSLKTCMLRRKKSDVLKDLPPINRINEYHELSPKAKSQYKKIMEGIYETLREWNPEAAGSEQKINNILVQMLRMKQVVSIDKVDHISDMAIDLSDSDTNGKAGKVLIFSQFKPVVKEVAKRLGNEAIAYHGDMSQGERQAAVDEFCASDEKKFLVGTIQTMGTGLNLEVANNVLFTDLDWTPANHSQAEERAYGRLSNPHNINAYYLLADGTIEDDIQQLLAEKMAIIEQTTEGLNVERVASGSIVRDLLKRMKKKGF